MKLCIPPLGALLRLNEEWQFRLYFEGRNATLLAAVLDGSKKLTIPSDRYLEDWSSRSHLPEPDWVKREQNRWKSLLASFKKVGYRVYRPEKVKTQDEVYDSYLTQIPLPYINVSLPTSTVLAIDRYYIRQGAEAFDSMTFKIEKCPIEMLQNTSKNAKFPTRRFWARLQDVNNMECEVLG